MIDLSTAFHGYPQHSAATQRHSAAFRGTTRLSAGVRGGPRLSAAFHGIPRPSAAVTGSASGRRGCCAKGAATARLLAILLVLVLLAVAEVEVAIQQGVDAVRVCILVLLSVLCVSRRRVFSLEPSVILCYST